MNTFLKKHVCFGVITIILVTMSCSKEDIQTENKNDFNVVTTENLHEEIDKYYELTKSIPDDSPEVFAKGLTSIKGVHAITVEGEIVNAILPNGIPVCFDFSSIEKTTNAEDKRDDDDDSTKKLFNDLLKDIQDSTMSGCENLPIEDDNNNAPSRSITFSNHHVSKTRKIAYWGPWKDFRSYEEKSLKKWAEEYSFNLTFLDASNPKSLSEFGNYDIVFVSSHGAQIGKLVIPEHLVDNYTQQYKLKDSNKLDTASLIKDDVSIVLKMKLPDSEQDKALLLGHKYLLDKLSPKLDNTIIWNSACYGGQEKGHFLASAVQKGCPCFIGPTEECFTAKMLDDFNDFLYYMSNGVSSVDAAINVQKNDNILKWHFVDTSFCYPIAGVSGMRAICGRTAIVGAYLQYGIPNKYTKNTTVTELGISLTNEITHEVQNIIINESNLYYANTESYNKEKLNVFYANVYLNNLNLETPYSYRSFVKIGDYYYYSKDKASFTSDKLSGYYFTKFTDHDGHHEEYEGYHLFTDEPFDINNPKGWRYYATRIDGNNIRWETWTSPYYSAGKCEYKSEYIGTINNDYTEISVSSWGWSAYAFDDPARAEEHANKYGGDHHHNVSEVSERTQSFLEMKKVPTWNTK